MASSFPEVVKVNPTRKKTLLLDYTWRPYASVATYTGTTNVTYNQEGYGNLVHCMRSTPYKPGQFKLQRFSAMTRTHEFVGPGSTTFDLGPYPKPYWKFIGNLTSYGFPSISVPLSSIPGIAGDNLMDWALVEASAGLTEPQIGVGQMLAEAGETAKFLVNPMSAFSSLYKDIHRKHGSKLGRRKAVKSADYVASTWLAYRYGLMPLVYDISDLVRGLSAKLDENVLLRSGGASPLSKSTSTRSVTKSLLALNLFFQDTTVDEVRAHARVYYNYHLAANSASETMLQLGIHPTQWVGLLWEKTLYSFVADWVLNVGGWLAAIQPKPNRTIRGNCVTLKQVKRMERTITKVTSSWSSVNPALAALPPPLDAGVATDSIVHRTINVPLSPTPPWQFSTLSWKRQLDSLALGWEPTKRIAHSIVQSRR